MNDLFGQAVAEPVKNPVKGYPRPPGTGPAGQTCKTCQFLCRLKPHRKVYLKCLMNERRWTNGPGSDIRAGSPACALWEKAEALTEAERTALSRLLTGR